MKCHLMKTTAVRRRPCKLVRIYHWLSHILIEPPVTPSHPAAPATGIDPNLGHVSVSQQPTDVLQHHWALNRPPNLPWPTTTPAQHLAVSSPLPPSSLPALSSTPATSPGLPSLGSEMSRPSTRRTRNSRTTTDGNNARTMAFYPKHWKQVIEYAKQTFRVYLACNNGFPSNIVGIREAKDLLQKSLVLYRSDSN
jgi:hypothetical protein